LLTVAAQAAPAVGANVSGALSQNPALLGFAPVFTAAVDVDAAMPGVAGLQSLIDEWYDEDTEQLKIHVDFSSQDKAEETLETLNRAFSTLQDGQLSAVTGLTLGRLGLGVTASAATQTVDRSSIVTDDDAPSPADQAAFTLLKEQLLEVLKGLTPREEKVLRLRFGLDDGRQRTLEEVGREFNVTRERIRQIEAKALRKMRHPSRSKKLKEYLD